jgi:hypothetical protein
MFFIFQTYVNDKQRKPELDLKNMLLKPDNYAVAESTGTVKPRAPVEMLNKTQKKAPAVPIMSQTEFMAKANKVNVSETTKPPEVKQVEDKGNYAFKKSENGELTIINTKTGKAASDAEIGRLVNQPDITPQEITWLKKTVQWVGENAPVVGTIVEAYKATKAWIEYNAHPIKENLVEAVKDTAAFVVKAVFDSVMLIPGAGIATAALKTKAGGMAVNFVEKMLGSAFKSVEKEVLAGVSEQITEHGTHELIKTGSEIIGKNGAAWMAKKAA